MILEMESNLALKDLPREEEKKGVEEEVKVGGLFHNYASEIKIAEKPKAPQVDEDELAKRKAKL